MDTDPRSRICGTDPRRNCGSGGSLERFNKAIAARGKPVDGILGGDLGEGFTDGLEQLLVGARLGGAQQGVLRIS